MNCTFCSNNKASGIIEGHVACANCIKKRDTILGIHKLTKQATKENVGQSFASKNK